MREIKFRLRNRHNKIVGYEKWYVGHWHPDNPNEGFSPTSGYWEASPCWLYSTDGERWIPSCIPHRYKDEYTGLKDKNGVEIYEGDIVRGRYLFPDNVIVVWDDALCSFQLHNNLDEISKSEHFLDLSGEGDLGYVYWEVIGNIYENPELFQEEEDDQREV